MIEQTIHDLLSSLVDGRIYPDTLPDVPVYPAITYQQVGGESLWFGENAMPDHKHARMQINVWSNTRLEASNISAQVEAAICGSGLVAQSYGASVSLYESALKLYGTRQDFGIWFPDN